MAVNLKVVKEITEGEVTRKVWVTDKTLHKVVEDAEHNKSWADASIKKVVEDAQHNKSWETV